MKKSDEQIFETKKTRMAVSFSKIKKKIAKKPAKKPATPKDKKSKVEESLPAVEDVVSAAIGLDTSVEVADISAGDAGLSETLDEEFPPLETLDTTDEDLDIKEPLDGENNAEGDVSDEWNEFPPLETLTDNEDVIDEIASNDEDVLEESLEPLELDEVVEELPSLENDGLEEPLDASSLELDVSGADEDSEANEVSDIDAFSLNMLNVSEPEDKANTSVDSSVDGLQALDEDNSSDKLVKESMPMPDLDVGLELEELDDEEIADLDGDDEEIPVLSISRVENIDDEFEAVDEADVEEVPKTVVGFYKRVLEVVYESEDLGIDATAKARMEEILDGDILPQLMVRDLILHKILTKQQLARGIARTQKRKEITSFLGVPGEAMDLKQNMDSRALSVLRDARIIPLWLKTKKDNTKELHLAHETAVRDFLIESALAEMIHNCSFVWHFAVRDVCGAYWLSGSSEDVDSSMEAEALLDRLIGNAIDARSSDIHIDPSIKGEFKAMVKYRVDGLVQSKEVITLDQLERLRIRIENIARMPKVDLHHPNKGAFSRAGYDWRVQIQPHAGRQGPVPRIVIRRLQPDVMGMEQLGYPQYFIDQVKASAEAPNGVLFWTGPTGSGKTESIHSAVVSVNPMGRGLSVHTIEDPPEKRVPGYSVQMEISDADPARSGMELLKSSLRADPDVVIFGEVRDAKMASLVFEASNTGHLVFTTLHTNTALDAIVRLDELGIYGFLVSYIRVIVAQRLIRRLCVHCREKIVGDPGEYAHYVFDKYGVDLEGATLYKSHEGGCPSCSHSGYYGRIAIAELLRPSKELVELSINRKYEDLEQVARRAGWQPMGYMGVLHVKNGITDIAELSSKVLELSGESLEG